MLVFSVSLYRIVELWVAVERLHLPIMTPNFHHYSNGRKNAMHPPCVCRVINVTKPENAQPLVTGFCVDVFQCDASSLTCPLSVDMPPFLACSMSHLHLSQCIP